MLIIAGITVGTLTGKNGTISNAENAEAEKNKSEEKETVEWAAAQSVADNDIGQVTSGNLEHYMDSYIGEDPEGVMDYEIDDGYHGIFLVEFTVSGNKYTVDENGMVYEGEELNRDGIELPDNLVLNVGESVKLEYTTESENVTWSNSNEEIAKLEDDGTVTGLSNGITIITVTTDKNKTDRCYVTVQTSPTGLNLNAVSAVLDRSHVPELQLEVVSYMPETANVGTNVTWVSSDTSVATVDETGFVKGIKNGNATITATTENGKTATCRIVVVTTITAISVEPNRVVIKPGETATILAHIKPDDGTCTEDVIWTSSNTRVAKVSLSGNNQTTCTVTSIGSGEVTITAKNTDGKIKSTCKVVVLPTISNTSGTYSVKAWYEDIYREECHTESSFELVPCPPSMEEAEEETGDTIYCADDVTRTVCEDVYAGQELRTDSATINFKLSSYFDTSKLRLVKEGISQVSVGGIQVVNRNSATYRINISTSSTNFGSGKLKLMYDDGYISIEIYSWNITCRY